MKIGLVAFPSKELQNIANGYRKRYDPHYSRVTPHVTLKNPFEVHESDIQNIASTIQKITEHQHPFSLQIEKVSSFSPVTNTIYFKIVNNDDLQSLHNNLNISSVGDICEIPFVPHLTIAQKLSSSEHDDILSQLQMVRIDHEELIDRIHLLYQLDDGSWSNYESFHLKGGR